MSFQFRFDSVLQLRNRERDTAAGAVSEVRRAIEMVDGKIEELQMELADLDRQRRDSLLGAIELNPLIEVQRYQLLLIGQIQYLQKQRETLVVEQHRREAILVKAQQAVKSFEKLEEHQRQEHAKVEASQLQSGWMNGPIPDLPCNKIVQTNLGN